MTLFGTDGIRGRYDEFNHRKLVTVLSSVVNQLPYSRARLSDKYVLVGEDTRSSSSCISANIVAILTSMGFNVYYGGVMPSSAVAVLTEYYHCQLGIAVTASHNREPDNGIKFFDGSGAKFSREVERKIEDHWLSLSEKKESVTFRPAVFGKFEVLERSKWNRDYISVLVKVFKDESIDVPAQLALDLSNGAYCSVDIKRFVPQLDSLVLFNALPDGKNINVCKDTSYIEEVKNNRPVYRYDGDGDRCNVILRGKELRDGQLILLLALRQKSLKEKLITTYMTNEGIVREIRKMGVELDVIEEVGDLPMYKQMVEQDIPLGGEASGHVIMRKHLKISDALVTTVLLNSVLSKQGALDILNTIKIWPSLDVNFPSKNYDKKLEEISSLFLEFPNAKKILRRSGTEPIIRLHVEAEDIDEIKAIREKIRKSCRCDV